MADRPFRRTPASTLRITAATGSTAAPLPNLPHGGGCTVRMWNRGTVPVSVEFGGKPDTTVAIAPNGSAPGSMSIPVGAVEFQTLQTGERFVAVAVASGTPDIEFTPGEGG